MINNMKETTGATALAALPKSAIDIADEKQYNLYTTTTTATATKTTTKTICNQNSTPTKSKSILSWLKSATKSFDSAANNQSQKQNNTPNTTCSCEGVTEIRPKSADTSLVNSYREFRGVQTLRHLWNKRISSASCEVSNAAKSIGNANTKKLTKSVSCLVTAPANLYETEIPNGTCNDKNEDANDYGVVKRRRNQTTKRAFSLYDCTNLGNGADDAHEPPSDINFRLHCEKDNFYKYKTAEQASKHLTRDTKMKAKLLTKRLSAGIVSESVPESDQHFPAIKASAKGERIHWLRRDERIVTTAKRDVHLLDGEEGELALRTTKNNENKDIKAATDKSSKHDANATPVLHTTNNSSGSSENTDTGDDSTLTATNSPQYVRSFTLNTLRKTTSDTTTASGSNSKRSSLNSISSSSGGTLETGSPGGTGTRTRKHPASARKYSFKTHAKTYHPPRKMLHTNKPQPGDSSNASSGVVTGSIVAKLTQQFNEIIQKDKKLLQEVKRKNGVLLTRGGHVYKVVETTKGGTQKSTNPSTVRRTIKKFENGAEEKPEPPAKSLQVLRKREELVKSKSQAGSEGVLAKRHSPLTSSNSSKSELKLELNKTPLKPLEVVKEETLVKTPLDTEGKSVVATIAGDELANVSNSQNADSTFKYTKQDEHKNSSNNNDDNKANNVNQAETNGTANAVETTQINKVAVVVADNKSNDVAETTGEKNEKQQQQFHRLPPEGQEAVASNLEQQQQDKQPQGEQSKEIFIMPTFPMASSANDNCEVELRTQQKIVNPTSSQEELDGAAVVSCDEKLKQRKHRYAKIYEKFRFRSPFSSGQSKKPTSATTSPSRSSEEKTNFKGEDEASRKKFENEETATVNAEAKILDALEVIDQKLKGLADEATTTMSTAKATDVETSIVLCTNDDFERRLLPNTSFVYQTTMKQVHDAQIRVAQAVNVTLVNNIEGEQLLKEQDVGLMDGNRYPIRVIEIATTEQPQNSENTYREIVKENKKQKSSVATKPLEEEEIMYEPITPKTEKPKTEDLNPQESFIFKRCKSVQSKEDSTMTDDIYQTVEEASAGATTQNTPAIATAMLDGYESIAGSCEASQPLPPPLPPPIVLVSTQTSTQQQYYDGYEICEPPPDEKQPVTPTLPSPTSYGSALVRNTNDELPELPEPKRILPKSPLPCKKLPPTPTKCSTEKPLPPTLPLPQSHFPLIDDNDDHHYYADDENIYDTIKGAHCYESLQTATASSTSAASVKHLQKNGVKSVDTISLTSNCYESITHYRLLATANNATANNPHGCMPIPLRSAGSTSTISSDHKTNSLYEVSLAAGLLYNGSGPHGFSGGSSSGSSHKQIGRSRAGSVHSSTGHITVNVNKYSNSIAASSDNSDEWVDITDNEAEGDDKVAGGDNDDAAVKQQFIVVRERSKVHRSPDWSKRVRDKRLQHQKAISCIEDDSDHYYESLSPLSNKRHSMHSTVQRTNSHHKRNQDLPLYVLRASQRRQQHSQQHSASSHALGQRFSDDYDSFDTDTDEIYETEENLKNHNDSGVDIRNVKLPDPPPSTNQVYAMVKKFKNFISNKKSPNSLKYGGSQQKIYENSSQFYVDGNIYLNTPKSMGKTTKSLKGIKSTPTKEDTEDYENAEFHSPPTVAASLSTSDKNLNTHSSNTELVQNESSATTTPTVNAATAPRPKSKSGKSFKSRLRKSLVGSTFEAKQLSLLTPTRSTFYIEDPSHGGSGELDSGFSEKASNGDLTSAVNTVIVTPTTDSQKFSTVARKAKKESKSANSQRRRTTIGIRPHEPPPPPPPADTEVALRIKSRSAATTSWYAECGVFKNGTSLNNEHATLMNGNSTSGGKRDSQSQHGSIALGSTSWYAEAGLYQTSGESVASSSGSSGVSTGNEAGLGDDMPHSMFQNEPLYQIYSAAKLQSLSRDLEDQDGGSTDGYEEIGQHSGSGGDASVLEDCQKRSRPTALQLVGPKSGPSRTLWSEIPEVINSCILPTLTPRERGFQEAKFEIITSEASYLKSLNLLRSHFMNHPVFRDTTVVSARDRKALFSHIVPVHECSERLLTALESCWQDNIMLLGLSKSIYAVAEKHFHVYISFCEHQGRMDRTLRRLKESKGSIFSQNLDLLESSPTCCGLNLHSFLMLPMQRITRLPLLIDAVFSKANPNDDEYDSWKMTLAIMNKIVTQCNDAANRCEQAYEIERISRQLEFPTTIRSLAIAPVGVAAPGSKPRFLVKKGELTHLIWRGDDAKLTFGKKFTKSTIFAFLFSDLLVLTKRRSEQQFLVFDYCPRNMLTISSGDLLPQLPTKDINQTGKNLILMTLLENHERKTIELVLSCPSVSEQERWLQAMRPPEAETPGEKLYEQWDCPQVIAKHAYVSKEPDALGLEIGDVVNVSRKLPDGWYQGERIRDGAIGWFPGNFTEEVNSAHVRARNLKQRYRLLTFTATYLESQKRK